MQITQKNFYKKFLGRAGELKAVEYLKQKGYNILDTNYKTHVGEADIIAKTNETTVFIEVKTRSSSVYGTPAEAVNYKKREKYFLLASQYLQKKGLTDKPCRFDVVEIENGQINHIENAFCM